jgi:hypothetical protein
VTLVGISNSQLEEEYNRTVISDVFIVGRKAPWNWRQAMALHPDVYGPYKEYYESQEQEKDTRS